MKINFMIKFLTLYSLNHFITILITTYLVCLITSNDHRFMRFTSFAGKSRWKMWELVKEMTLILVYQSYNDFHEQVIRQRYTKKIYKRICWIVDSSVNVNSLDGRPSHVVAINNPTSISSLLSPLLPDSK